MGVLDDIKNRRRGTMTRQEAVAPTPQQAIAQTSQSAPLQDNNKRQPYRATGAGGFTTYKDRNGKIQMVGVPGATILPGQGNRSSDVDTEAQQQGKFHINGLGAADGTVTQPEQTEIPRRTHQTAGGAAMPVGRSTAPVATNGYTYDQAVEGMKRFNGNVDLYHRPVVSSEAMNNAGYNIPAGNTATVYSMQRGIRDKSGRVREVLYTPITATGEVMSQKDIDAYIDGLDGSDDILATDKAGKGMIIHLDANPNGNDGQDLHLMQEAYGRGPQQAKQTQPVQVITPQQAKDAVNSVAQGIQQRADARKQEELAKNRHQNSADPMNRLFNPVNPQQPQQSSGTANQAGVDQQPQVADMNDLLAYLARDSKQKLDEETETPEQKAAREKREKRQALMAKIGDGLGAFHEAYSYMMGNKPMTSGSLSAAQEARIKALGLERDKKYNDALNNYLKVMDAQRKEDYYKSIAETRRAEQESRDASRRSKEAREQEKLDLQKLLREDKQRTQSEKSSYWDAYWYARDVEGRSEEDAKKYASEYSFKVREQENANEQALNDAKVKKEQSATQKNQAQAAKTKAGGSGKSSSGTYTTVSDKTEYDKKGNVKGRVVTKTTKSPGGGGSRSSKKPTGRSNSKKKTNVKWK